MTKKRIKGGVRLRDVASAAGVSSTTASLVANGRAEKYGICPATRERVLAAIRQLGYSPSLAALDMAAGRNTLIGLAISADFPAYEHRMAALEPLLAQAGFRLMVVILPGDPQAAMARITELVQFGVAGLVVCPSGPLTLPKLNCPAIVVGQAGTGLPAVYEDEAEGGRRLARRLLDKGHWHVAMVGAAPAAPATAGFMEACAQGGVTVRSFGSVPEFMAVSGTLTAVYCGSTAALMEVYGRGAAAIQAKALAVVAVDHVGVAAQMFPRPAVLQPGIAKLGQAVVQLLRQVLQGESPGDIRLDPVIFEGDPIVSPPIVPPVITPPVNVPTPKPVLVTPPAAPPPAPVITPRIPVVPQPAANPESVSPVPAVTQAPTPITIPSVVVEPPPQVEVTPSPVIVTPAPIAETPPVGPETPAPVVEAGVPAGLANRSFAEDVERHPDVPVPEIAEEPAPALSVVVEPLPQVEVTPPPVVAKPEPMPEPPPVASEIPASNPAPAIVEEPAPAPSVSNT